MKLSAYTSLVRSCFSDQTGQFALGFALMAPLLFGLIGGAIDLVAFERNMKRMQDAADHAALAAAREGSLQGWNEQIATEIAIRFASENLGQPVIPSSAQDPGAQSSPGGEYRIDAAIDAAKKSVSVTIENDYYPYFFIGYFRHSPQISVNAKANVTGNMNICVVGLDPSQSSTVKLANSAHLTAPNCAVFSNSTAPDGLSATQDSLLMTSYSCSVGGFKGAAINYTTPPVTDCRPAEDPLAARGVPSSMGCDFTNKVVSNKIEALTPGTYCGGIHITKHSKVEFKPGTYVIKDGELKSDVGGTASGTGVTFVFVGNNSAMNFDKTTTLSFSAPETGPYAGILMYQDPAAPNLQTFEISSVFASKLLGTIYLPNGIFKVHAGSKVGEQSAFTVILARKMDIGSSANLVINTDYASTSVPVPDGVGPQNGVVRLTN